MATLFNNVANTNTVNYVPVQATFSASGSFLTFIGPGGVPFTAGGSLAINSTPITGGTSGRILFDNAGTVGEKSVTGTGNVVLSASPTLSGTVNLSSLTASQAVFTDASKNLVSVATTGTGSVVLSTSPAFDAGASFGSNIFILNTKFGVGTGTRSILVGTDAKANSLNDVVIGYEAFKFNSGGVDGQGDNTIIGSNAFSDTFNTYETVAIGSGINMGQGNSATGGVFIGQGVTSGVPTGQDSDNEIIIGSYQTGIGSNTTTIGRNATTTARIYGNVVTGIVHTPASAPTIASATTIAPTTRIVFVSGTTPIATITPPAPTTAIPTTDYGTQITLIPTGVFTTTTAGNIALASVAVVKKALIMTYDSTTNKWYPSY
jgi:hypothetical protein